MPERGSKIAVLRCLSCGHLDQPPRICCTACGGDAFAEEIVSGTGKLVSWTIVRYPPESFGTAGPVTIALVDLDAGLRLTGRLESSSAPKTGLQVHLFSSGDGPLLFAEEGA